MNYEPGLSETTEHQLIDWIGRTLGNRHIGDDCAVLPGGMLVTTDTLVEGTHFALDLTSWSDLGWKAVAVNLSDIAAMGGRPRQVVVSLTLPESFRLADFRSLYGGMVECARTYRGEIVGGDLTRGPVLSLTLTIIGEAHENGCLLRSGACSGDLVVVTGDFGGSAAGLWALRQGLSGFDSVKRRHNRPLPRFAEAWRMIEVTGSRGALMDASDGLADALVQLARASQVGMEIDTARLPIADETKKAAACASVDYLDWALYGGEDFELVGTLPASAWQSLSRLCPQHFQSIGVVTAGRAVVLAGQPQARQIDLTKGFQHWP
jgi:thiamine-monophosphate kinase